MKKENPMAFIGMLAKELKNINKAIDQHDSYLESIRGFVQEENDITNLGELAVQRYQVETELEALFVAAYTAKRELEKEIDKHNIKGNR